MAHSYYRLLYAAATCLLLYLVLIGHVGVVAGTAAAVAEEVEHCDLDEPDNAKASDKYDPSFCQEVITYDKPDLYNQDDYNILAALATSVLNKTYPSRLNTLHAFAIYDEMPHPVPTGRKTAIDEAELRIILFHGSFYCDFYVVLQQIHSPAISVALGAYKPVSRYRSFSKYKTVHAPAVTTRKSSKPAYAKYMGLHYLLQPSDPLVNPDEVIKTWADFHLPQNVWAIIKAVLRVNALDESQVYFHDNPNLGRNSEKVDKITQSEGTIAADNIDKSDVTGMSWRTFRAGSFIPTGSKSLQEVKSVSKRTEEQEPSEESLEDIVLRRSGNQHQLGNEKKESPVHHFSVESLHSIF
ncbi:hypothetical protein Ocin01_10420 [Orchesella cincta]|uniref:Uncharacterized protein n=1 Tax=Orchesella cincta TaxID=48709 RepID=A0A1D2MU82_ORCCI|nr:hypothetical protein Ocin01_10420 [Orchesella cincta]